MNQDVSSRNSSGVKGVSFDKRSGKWHSRICVNRKTKHLGLYNTIEEAKLARQAKALELFKEFANEV
jgi:hypothetical protein